MTRTVPVVVVLLLSNTAFAEEVGDSEVRRRADFVPGQQQSGNGGWIFAHSSQLPGQLEATMVSRFTYNSSGNPAPPFARHLRGPAGGAAGGGAGGGTPRIGAQGTRRP